MFFNTLFDENACCHVAAGAGFPEVLDGFLEMSNEEILEKGVNDSLIHVDFMVGSDDLHIVGIREDGSETDIFVNGTWQSKSAVFRNRSRGLPLFSQKKADPGQSTVFCRLPRVLFLKKISFQTSLFSYKDFDTAKSQVLLP